jgi:hypothetical protein
VATGDFAVDADGARRSRWPLAAAAAGYLAVSLWLFFDVLTLSFTHGATCTCSDVSQFTWFLSWPSVAATKLTNPFFSTAMFHPDGINLLANTSVTGLGIPLAPLEWLIGPGATMNVALVLTPVASGVAMMWLARRFVRNEALCALAGLIYAFSPMVLFHQALGHLNVTFLAIPPILAGLIHELFWVRAARPRRVGLAIGALLAWQFLVGSETFAMTVVVGAVSLAVLASAAALTDRAALVESWRAARAGVGWAAATAAVLLVGPVAYATLGPRHYSGAVWPGTTLSNASLASFFVAQPGPKLWFAPSSWSYLQATYLAPAIVLTVVIGVVVFRRDRRLLAISLLGALCAWLALGPRYVFAPWHLARHLPLLENIANERFASFMFLFATLALAIVLDHALELRPRAGALAAVIVATAASVAPYAIDAAHMAPYPASTLWVPQWYAASVPQMAPGRVVLGFPFFNTSANLLGVQAHFKMAYSVVGGTTPQWLPIRQGDEAPGYRVIWNLASTAAAPEMSPTASSLQRAAVLLALSGWGVTDVVVPMTNGPNTSPVARAPAFVEHFLASILGPSRVSHGAWVWRL